MICYRLKHKPSGLYYIPSRKLQIKTSHFTGHAYIKSNLSKKGKVYQQKPSFKWIGEMFYNHQLAVSRAEGDSVRRGFEQVRDSWAIDYFRADEWEIEEV